MLNELEALLAQSGASNFANQVSWNRLLIALSSEAGEFNRARICRLIVEYGRGWITLHSANQHELGNAIKALTVIADQFKNELALHRLLLLNLAQFHELLDGRDQQVQYARIATDLEIARSAGLHPSLIGHRTVGVATLLLGRRQLLADQQVRPAFDTLEATLRAFTHAQFFADLANLWLIEACRRSPAHNYRAGLAAQQISFDSSSRNSFAYTGDHNDLVLLATEPYLEP